MFGIIFVWVGPRFEDDSPRKERVFNLQAMENILKGARRLIE